MRDYQSIGVDGPVCGLPGAGPRAVEGGTRGAVVNSLMLIYLASGACALVDEVIWVRLLKLSLGNTVYASSVVVSVFMAGLGLGALLMGRYCDRVRRPLRLYALIELAVTGLTLLSPWALRSADAAYLWLCRSWPGGQSGWMPGQVAISALVLLVPTLLMGSTLPLLARFVASVEKEAGPAIGRLYALNMLGAAAGCFLAGFVLIGWLGVMGTLRLAAMVNLLVALGAYLMHHLVGGSAREIAAETLIRPGAVRSGRAWDLGLFLLAGSFFLSGAVSIGYELLWMRSIVHSAGAFTYVFSSVLTAYLAGNVVGAALGSRIVRDLRHPAVVSAVLLAVLGLCGVLYLPWLSFCTRYLLAWILGPLDESIWYQPAPWDAGNLLIRSAVLFLPPALIMGLAFPITLQAWVDRAHRIGWSTGTAYGTNTWGAVAGGLATGFALIPLLGVQAALMVLGLAAVWMGCVLWLYFVRSATQRWLWRCVLPLAAVCITVQSQQMPRDLFRRIVARSRWMQACALVDVKEGVNTTVSIHRDPRDNALYLCTSGGRVAGTSREYRGDQKMLGHFPVLLNRDARSVLSVGFGSGESTACLARHAIERVDCVEIAPEVVALSLKHFHAINLGPELDRKVHMIYQDARNYLHLTDRRYDAIVNDCTSMRGVAENASLYTREYFESARQRLTEHGLFMSWLDTQASECPEVVDSVIGTVMEVFPYVTLWYMTTEPGCYYIIVGSLRPQSFSPWHIARELAKPAVKESLALVSCRDSLDVLSCYVADEQDLRRYLTQHRTNSDYFPVVEFCAEPEPAGFQVERRFFTTVRSDSVYEHLDWTGVGESEKAQWLARFETVRRAAEQVFLAESAPDCLEMLRHSLAGLRILPGHHGLTVSRQKAEHALLEDGLKSLDAGKKDRAMYLARGLLGVDPNSAAGWVLLAQAARVTGDLSLAKAAAQRALQIAPDDLGTHFNLWSVLVSANDPAGAAAVLHAGTRGEQ
jgi:spermidine synthase